MSIDTRLGLEDVKELIKALDALEMIQMTEFMLAKEVLSIPEVPEDHPAFEYILQLKEKFKGREQVLADKVDSCKEICTTLKAKLYYIKKEIGCDGLFNAPENSFESKGEEEAGKQQEDGVENQLRKLKEQIEKAIDNEDYEEAARIKKELEKLE